MFEKFSSKLFFNIIKLFFGISLLIILIFFADVEKIKLAFSSIIFSELCYVLIFWLGVVVFQALRLLIISKYFGEINFKSTLKVIFIAFAFNNLLPATIGGDVYKIIFLVKKFKADKLKVSMLILWDRILAILAVIIITLFVLITNLQLFIKPLNDLLKKMSFNFLLFGFILILGGIFTIGIGIYLRYKQINILKSIYSSISALGVKNNLSLFLCEMMTFICRVFKFYFLFKVFATLIQVELMFFSVGATNIFSMLPISFGGVGVFEATLTVVTTNLVVIPFSIVISVCIVNRLLQIIASIFGVILLIFNREKSDTINNDSSSGI